MNKEALTIISGLVANPNLVKTIEDVDKVLNHYSKIVVMLNRLEEPKQATINLPPKH